MVWYTVTGPKFRNMMREETFAGYASACTQTARIWKTYMYARLQVVPAVQSEAALKPGDIHAAQAGRCTS